jgi:hypothetical protein
MAGTTITGATISGIWRDVFHDVNLFLYVRYVSFLTMTIVAHGQERVKGEFPPIKN